MTDPDSQSGLVPVIETERLVLRGFREQDLDEWAAMCADEETMRHIGGPADRGGAWRQMAGALGHWQLRGYGLWAVARQSDGALVGRVGAIEPEGWPRFEIGWMLGRDYWGQGYAFEAATAAMDHAFDVLAKVRIISLVAPENTASAKLAERLGEVPSGETVVMNTHVVIWSIDADTWRMRRTNIDTQGESG